MFLMMMNRSCDHNNENKFNKKQENINKYNGAKHVIFRKIYDYFENVITVAPSQDFKPCGLGLFQDPHCE